MDSEVMALRAELMHIKCDTLRSEVRLETALSDIRIAECFTEIMRGARDFNMVGLLAQHVRCEECGKWWDTISPCALCNATRSFPNFRI